MRVWVDEESAQSVGKNGFVCGGARIWQIVDCTHKISVDADEKVDMFLESILNQHLKIQIYFILLNCRFLFFGRPVDWDSHTCR